MAEKPEKIVSYIGFALRARKIKAGVNAIGTVKRGIYLLIMGESAAPNTKKEALSLAARHHAKIVVTKDILLADIVGKENCKLVALTDRNLSRAILDNLNEHFVILEANN